MITPVVMCGGAGTRLWPLSRESLPKQFTQLTGVQSTFQEALRRVQSDGLFHKPVIITSADSRFIVAEQIRALQLEADIVLEPMRRDSAAAVAVAAEITRRQHPDGLVLVMAADHLIEPIATFHEACEKGIPAAMAGKIVTFGIEPTGPSTRYGYIRPGPVVSGEETLSVEAFFEKPGIDLAQQYIRDGYLWNSGNFLFRADMMMAEIERFMPAIAAAARLAVEEAKSDLDFLRLDEDAFAQAPKVSIDYAVMEKTAHAAVLPVDFQWSDVGNWEAVLSVSKVDAEGNAVKGTAELLGTKNSLVISEENMLTAVVGCQDIIVVTTADAVLVTTRQEAERVKDLVERMRGDDRIEVLEHRRMYRPWGYYQGVDKGGRFQVKRIVVKPAGKLSLQKHFHRAEHWVVVRGTAAVTVDDREIIVHENESVYIPMGSVHRLANPGKIPLDLIEVQVGSYLGEDDIVRLDDVYHR